MTDTDPIAPRLNADRITLLSKATASNGGLRHSPVHEAGSRAGQSPPLRPPGRVSNSRAVRDRPGSDDKRGVHEQIDVQQRKVAEQAARLQQKGSARILHELTKGPSHVSIPGSRPAGRGDPFSSGRGRGKSAGATALQSSTAYDPDFDRSRHQFVAKPFAGTGSQAAESIVSDQVGSAQPPPLRSYEEEFPSLGQ